MGVLEVARDHLSRDFTEPVRDPVWKNLGLSPGLLRLVALPAFQKLNGIKQLGPAYLVYPGATHTRLSHSLGVLHLARRLLGRLLEHRGPETRIPDSALEPEAVRAYLCAALLHDLGHYPFAHSLKDLQVASHESLTAEQLLNGEMAGALRREVGTDPRLVAAIVDPQRPVPDAGAAGFYRRLLSGVLDPDKLDYLNRDAYYCGVPYGIQDVDFALGELRAQPQGLAVTRKGLTAVESVLFSKYLMYRSVYWHKTVRIATSMIKKAVSMAMEAGELQVGELYGLDDQEFFALAERKAFPPLELLARVARRRLYKQVASFAFDPADPGVAILERLPERLRREWEIAREATRALGRTVEPREILIDIPEPVSFEIDLPVLEAEGSRPFADSDSVFSGGIVQGFARSLRRVSLIAEADPPLVAALSGLGPQRLLGLASGERQA
jgi:HD superfamily phosphohydrolase